MVNVQDGYHLGVVIDGSQREALYNLLLLAAGGGGVKCSVD